MKKILFVLAVLSGLCWKAYSATTQAQNLGVVSISVKSLTAAQVITSTSTAAGELIFCSNCGGAGGAGTLCISTGTAANAFVLSTGTVCK